MHKDNYVNQWSKIDSLEINPHIESFDVQQGFYNNSWRKTSVFNKGC